MSRFRVLLDTIEQRSKFVRKIVFTCVVLHKMLRTQQGGADMTPSPRNDIAGLQNEQVVYVPDGNYRNPSREVTPQQDLLKYYFSDLGAMVGQQDRI